MPVVANLKVNLQIEERVPVAGLGSSFLRHALTMGPGSVESVQYGNGTSPNQQNLVWSNSVSIAATTLSLDLLGVLSSQLDGGSVNLARVTGFAIRNTSATATEVLTIGGNANAFVNWVGSATDTVVVGPGGILLVTSPIDGYATTAGTGDILDIDSGAATITAEILVWGATV